MKKTVVYPEAMVFLKKSELKQISSCSKDFYTAFQVIMNDFSFWTPTSPTFVGGFLQILIFICDRTLLIGYYTKMAAKVRVKEQSLRDFLWLLTDFNALELLN